MTAKSMQYDAKGQPQKMPGWFSWRHQTSDAHAEAVERYRTRASRRPKQCWDQALGRWVKGVSDR